MSKSESYVAAWPQNFRNADQTLRTPSEIVLSFLVFGLIFPENSEIAVKYFNHESCSFRTTLGLLMDDLSFKMTHDGIFAFLRIKISQTGSKRISKI